MVRSKVHYLLRVALSVSLLIIFSNQYPLHANELTAKFQVRSLEKSLNTTKIQTLIDFFPKKDRMELANRYEIFLNSFPNASWNIKEAQLLEDGRYLLEVLIIGDKIVKGEKYSMAANQILIVKVIGSKIIETELFSEETIIQSSKSPLSVNVNVPRSVLTGTTYDFDVILNKPLGNTMLIGGLIPITKKQIKNQLSPSIELEPLGGGGLFKSVQAPLQPGEQNWAAILAHPDGLISITKLVKIIADKSEISK